MALDPFVGGDDREAGTTSNEDALDRYRRDVERHLGDKLVLLDEEVFERFFDHIIGSFNRGTSSAECPRTWLHPTRARSARSRLGPRSP